MVEDRFTLIQPWFTRVTRSLSRKVISPSAGWKIPSYFTKICTKC